MEEDPITEKTGEGDSVHVEDNGEEIESDDIYVGRVFGDENEYHADNSYLWQKGLVSG